MNNNPSAELQAELKNIISERRLLPLYQPIVDTNNHRIFATRP